MHKVKSGDLVRVTVRDFADMPLPVMQDEVKVLGRIGEGAFGEVSLATCAIFGKVAVKWLKVNLLTGPFDHTTFLSLCSRFQILCLPRQGNTTVSYRLHHFEDCPKFARVLKLLGVCAASNGYLESCPLVRQS